MKLNQQQGMRGCRLHVFLINGTAKIKLPILAFLYCGEFVKKTLHCRCHGLQKYSFQFEKTSQFRSERN